MQLTKSLYICFVAFGSVFGTIYDWNFTAYASEKLQSILGYPPDTNNSYYGWTGGDVGTSIQISNNTFVWLFGDTLIAHYTNENNINQRYNPSYDHFNSSCNPWPHSSISLYNIESNDSMTYYISYTNNQSTSFFQPYPIKNNDTNQFWWTMSGISNKKYDKLVILAANVYCNPQSNTSFKWGINSTSIIIIENIKNENNQINNPMNWTYKHQIVPNTNATFNMFAGVSYVNNDVDNDMVYWIGVMVYNINCIAKVSLNDLINFNFDNVLYYGYNKTVPDVLGWYLFEDIRNLQWIIDEHLGGTELTLRYNDILQSWYLFRSESHATKIRLYLSETKEITSKYDWIYIYDIPYPWNNNSTYFCYAEKSHPELIEYKNHETNQLLFTYVCNTHGVGLLFQPHNGNVYIPQFVVVNFTKRTT